MKQAAVKESGRIPITQSEVLRRVFGSSEEDLFWFRIDMAEHWLKEIYRLEETTIRKYTADRTFWDWWIRMWAWSDSVLLDWMKEKGRQKIHFTQYKDDIKSHIMTKWVMTKALPPNQFKRLKSQAAV